MPAASTIILIPARMASERLPGKPLADLNGVPMIVEVMRRGEETGLGTVMVAAAESEIAEVVEAAGGTVILTDPQLPSGSDRIAAALAKADPDGLIEYVINLQGDLPTISPAAIAACHKALVNSGADIATLVAEIEDDDEIADPNVVKALVHFEEGKTTALAADFVRELPEEWTGGHYHHIGIYAYRRAALSRFVALAQSSREKTRKLEQMRALDNGMTIAVSLVDTIPFGVDTPADLERARQVLANNR